MVYNCALGTHSTSSRARIATFLVYTSLILGTIRIENTFWSTVRRAAYVTGYARAYSLTIHFSTLAIGTAGRGVAWIGINRI